MLFSQRKGLKPIKSVMQIDSIDDDLRNGLWNCLSLIYWEEVNPEYYSYDERMQKVIRRLWLNYFKWRIQTIPYRWDDILEIIQNYFFKAKWYEIYDFIEFIAENTIESEAKRFASTCNMIMEREMSTYRFVGTTIAQLTSENEIQQIEDSLEKTVPLKSVNEHLKSALLFLSDRKSPDYRNSIKESISAVEALSRIITNNPKATLGQALKIIKDKVELHPALEKAFENLYGYTSDESGIRHALLSESKLNFSDAKFMLVSCSAFINYLLDKVS